jgi:hypothetical protein
MILYCHIVLLLLSKQPSAALLGFRYLSSLLLSLVLTSDFVSEVINIQKMQHLLQLHFLQNVKFRKKQTLNCM